VHLFTAAAYSGKRKAGGWAVVLRFQENQRALQGGAEGAAVASANRMHLQAAVAGLQALTRPVKVHLYTTSDYLKDGATSWVAAWRQRGWRTKEGKPVSHRDLWQELARQTSRHEVQWHVVGKELPAALAEAKRLARAEVEGSGE
jgi:ribonuclease HI